MRLKASPALKGLNSYRFLDFQNIPEHAANDTEH